MNKKRKILTVVALAVFGAIIFFHYGSIDYKSAYEKVEYFRDKTVKPASWEDFKPATPKPFDFVPDKPPKKSTSDIFDDLPDQPPKKRWGSSHFRSWQSGGIFFAITHIPGDRVHCSCFWTGRGA